MRRGAGFSCRRTSSRTSRSPRTRPAGSVSARSNRSRHVTGNSLYGVSFARQRVHVARDRADVSSTDRMVRPTRRKTVGLIALLVVGLIVGALARAVLPGRQATPIWLTMLIGAASLFVAGLIVHTFIVALILGVVIAAAIIALTQGGIRSRGTTRV